MGQEVNLRWWIAAIGGEGHRLEHSKTLDGLTETILFDVLYSGSVTYSISDPKN